MLREERRSIPRTRLSSWISFKSVPKNRVSADSIEFSAPSLSQICRAPNRKPRGRLLWGTLPIMPLMEEVRAVWKVKEHFQNSRVLAPYGTLASSIRRQHVPSHLWCQLFDCQWTLHCERGASFFVYSLKGYPPPACGATCHPPCSAIAATRRREALIRSEGWRVKKTEGFRP